METIRQKLPILADAAKYDASCASSGAKRSGKGGALGNSDGTGICHSYTPDGRCVSLLKILLTNFCIYDCKFCVNRASSDTPRARFSVEEVVKLTMEFYRRNYIEGLFLSSGIIRSSDYTMEQMVAVAKQLREVERFRGYIHLKMVPGASPELVEAAGLLADRLSVNVELPTDEDLKSLAPEKSLSEIELGMSQVKARTVQARAERRESRKAPKFAPAGQSTQMVVGATPTSDRTILTSATHLYNRHGLRRIYYSGYSPHRFVDGHLPAVQTPLVREHRLYQADWLMRFYGFKADELTTTDDPTLDLTVDPKLRWALRHPEVFPVDVNRAPRRILLRIPGFGRTTVGKILRQRKSQRVTMLDLTKMRAPLKRAKPFIVASDFRPGQLEELALVGQLQQLEDSRAGRPQVADDSGAEQLSLLAS